MTTTGKSLDDFKRAHDPTFQLESVGQTFRRDINWKKTKRVFVVAAQNATPVHPDWWAVLNNMAATVGAELLVIPLRYKNPTSLWSGSQKNAEFWAPDVRPYLWNANEEISPDFMVLGDIKIQPTNSNPLSGADALSHSSSAVVGHTRAQSKSIPMMGRMAKFLTTSGACTMPNYSDSRVGKLGVFHHSLSAILYEKGRMPRRVSYSEKAGRCIDMGIAYYADRVEKAPPSLALVMGDTHVDFVDPDVVEATFGKGGIVARTRPQHLIWHDLLDGNSCNPHHDLDPFADIAKYYAGRSEVSAETQRAVEFVREHAPDGGPLSIIVPSNHNDFLRRWILKKDWKLLPAENRMFYLKTALHMAEHTALTDRGIEYPDPFTAIFRDAGVANARALDLGESFKLGDVELGMHGDNGPNGARGSIKNLRRVASKSIIGHAHSPGEDEGCTQVGTSTRIPLDYAVGSPSSWLNTHCDLNADGKRQLITIVKGEFCL